MTSNTATSVQDASAVRAVLSGILAAWADNDVDAFVACYADDATVVIPGSYLQDKQAIRAGMAAAFAGPLKGSRRVVEVQSVRLLGDDGAIVIGKSGIVPAGESETPADRWTLATWVLSEHDGDWLVDAYHDSPVNAGNEK
jgi:uncharacterized protein (TIGR02246 family)